MGIAQFICLIYNSLALGFWLCLLCIMPPWTFKYFSLIFSCFAIICSLEHIIELQFMGHKVRTRLDVVDAISFPARLQQFTLLPSMYGSTMSPSYLSPCHHLVCSLFILSLSLCLLSNHICLSALFYFLKTALTTFDFCMFR